MQLCTSCDIGSVGIARYRSVYRELAEIFSREPEDNTPPQCLPNPRSARRPRPRRRV